MRYECIVKIGKNKQPAVYLKVLSEAGDITVLKKFSNFTDKDELESAILERNDLLAAFAQFVDECEIKRLSCSTIVNYILMNMFFIFDEKIKYISDINYPNMKAYMLRLTKKGLSDATVATYLRHIKVFVCWLEKNGYISDPFSERILMPKTPKKNIAVFNEQEVGEIINAIKSYFAYDEFLLLRNLLIIALMLDSGLRQSEVIKINQEDYSCFDNDRILMTVHGKGKKERMLALGSHTSRLFKEYMKVNPFRDRKWLFATIRGERITAAAIASLFEKISELTGLRVSPHRLRHNFATNFCLDALKSNAEPDLYALMSLMGHNDIATTDRYLHLSKKYLSATAVYSHFDKMYAP